MAFTNWDDAWTIFHNQFAFAQIAAVNLYNEKSTLAIQTTITGVRNSAKKCMDYIYNCLEAHCGFNWLDPIDESWHYMAVYYAHGGTVDLQTINDAMREGTFPEIRDHLSLQWAFQQVMFDQPFFPESYTALVEYLRT